MSKEIEISLSEWKEALRVAVHNDEGKTARELAEDLGVSLVTVHRKLRASLKVKKIRAGLASRVDERGISRIIPVYQPIKRSTK